jgi:hypothetical protein
MLSDGVFVLYMCMILKRLSSHQRKGLDHAYDVGSRTEALLISTRFRICVDYFASKSSTSLHYFFIHRNKRRSCQKGGMGMFCSIPWVLATRMSASTLILSCKTSRGLLSPPIEACSTTHSGHYEGYRHSKRYETPEGPSTGRHAELLMEGVADLLTYFY